MAKERDYKHEAELAKARGDKVLTIKLTQSLYDKFSTKCKLNGTNKNAVLKKYIEQYTDENSDQ